MSDPSTQAAGWHPDPSGQHQLRYWDGQTWTDHVSDNSQQSTDPIPPPPPGGVPPMQYGAVAQYGQPQQRGPVGRTHNAGTVILLSIITLGIYTFIWTYRQFEDFKRYSGQGIGGTVGVILGIFINPVVWFLIPAELQGLYEAEGEECPVSALWGLWFLLPIIGNFVWYLKMQDVINDFWIRRGAPAP
jgi:Protein of unknown function (DUF2510)/Domain of unknown function (DUF4234)